MSSACNAQFTDDEFEVALSNSLQHFRHMSGLKRIKAEAMPVCKMGLTGIHDSYGSWHLYICRLFSVSRPFCFFTLVDEGHFVLCYKEKIEPLDRATIFRGHRSA